MSFDRQNVKVQAEPTKKYSDVYSTKTHVAGNNNVHSDIKYILGFQQTAGNKAAQRLIETRAVQMKLKIGQTNNSSDKDAKSVSTKVNQAPRYSTPEIMDSRSKDLLKETQNSTKLHNYYNVIQQNSLCNYTNSLIPKIVQNVLKSNGQPLDQETRTHMEQHFGYDFSKVRIHTDKNAADSASVLNSHAFTSKNNIVFNYGEYNPKSSEGKKLLAHELSHVMQQNSNNVTEKIQLWSYGAGNLADPNFIQVPAKERNRVDAAMKIITDVTKDKTCDNSIRSIITTGETANQLIARIKVWKYNITGNFGVSDMGDNIAYDDYVYRQGKWLIANTLMHEMMHAGGQNNEQQCESAAELCRIYAPTTLPSGAKITPSIAKVGQVVIIKGIGWGFSQGKNDRVEFDGINAERVISWVYSHGGTEIKTRVPAGLKPGNINVVVFNNNVPTEPIKMQIIP